MSGSLAERVRALSRGAGATVVDRERLVAAWQGGGELPDEARGVGELLAEVTATAAGVAGKVIASTDEGRAVVAAWCRAVAGDRDRVLAPLLTSLSHAETTAAEVRVAARARVRRGPLRDALACVSLCGAADWMDAPDQRPVAARLELLLWEAGQLAASVPELGRWLFGDEVALHRLVIDAASGSLRDRAIAARAVEVGADGIRVADLADDTAELLERTLRRLGAHPESAVWIPAARAIGRLAVALPEIRRLLEEWVTSDNIGERRRAVTSLAAMPLGGASRIGCDLDAVFDDSDPWVVAAVGPSIPHLAAENREVWERLVDRMERQALAPQALYGVTQGLAALRRREGADRLGDRFLRRARSRALTAQPKSATEGQLWLAIRSNTDFLDELEPDPGDPEQVLEGLVSSATRVGAERVAERARFVARSLRATFDSALPTAADAEPPGRRAASCRTIESTARAAALALWEPIMAAAELPPRGLAGEVDEARRHMVRAIAPRLSAADPDHSFTRSALRVLASAADAGGDLSAIMDAFETAPWLATSVRLVRRYRKPIAELLWRAVDATRTDPLASDPLLYRRFAAWWSLSSAAGQHVLEHLGRSEVAARDGVEPTLAAVQRIRSLLAPTAMGAVEGAWAIKLLEELETLGASDSALAEGLSGLAAALDMAMESRTFRSLSSLELALGLLSSAAEHLRLLIADPARALAPDREETAASEPGEVAELARAVRQSKRFETAEYADRWSRGLGPLLTPLVSRAVTLLLGAHQGLEATAESTSSEAVGRYRLVKKMGEGQMGSVWLVRDPDTDRHFVMKLPAAPWELASDDEQAFLDEAVALEADILKTIHHPNVANLIDYGLDDGRAYMVLEYLAGIDLEAYLAARLMTLAELKLVVADVCAGLRALHSRGLVHRDLKPGNIFMRLDLGEPGTPFDPRSHRDPRRTPPLAAVIIDFGLASTQRTAVEEGQTSALGTLGFMPPEQARGVAAVTGKADVYALAATVYAAVTGSAFFESRNLTTREWLRAHALENPLDDDPYAHELPAPLVQLVREAASINPASRPTIDTFAERFAMLE